MAKELTKQVLIEHTRVVENQLEEIYETVFGDEGTNGYSHEELLDRLNEMYDCYEYVVDNIYSEGKYLGKGSV